MDKKTISDDMYIDNPEGDQNEVINIAPGSEVDLISSIQKEMEREKQEKEEELLFGGGEVEEEDEVDSEEEIKKKFKKRKNKYIKKRVFIAIGKGLFFFGIPLLVFAGVAFLGWFFTFEDNLLTQLITFGPAVVLAGIIGAINFFVTQAIINKKIGYAESILNEIARGKLSYSIDRDIELSSNLGPLAKPIDRVIKEISDMVTKVELSAMDLSGNSNALKYFASSMSKKTDEQSTQIQNIDRSAKDMNESMQNIRTNVESAYEISKTSIQEADTSSVEILSLIEEMNTINEMSDKIITTMNFIDDIADETNLLALNASIQAAHAGEEGKGFGVVADEIRNLAESSSKATKTIYGIIEKTIESIQKGVSASEKAKKALNKIVTSIKSTEDLMAEINESINLQSDTTTTLKNSVENIQELTKNINSDTQNMESAISNLSGQADILTNLINQFEIHTSSIKSDVIFGVHGGDDQDESYSE